MNVIVDYSTSCFNISFRIPDSITLSDAQFNTLFLSYYKSDLSTTLNSIPYQRMKCLKQNLTNIHCFVVLCSKEEYQIEPATNYTFRASMLIDNINSIITQLSESTTVISWDACKLIKF